MRRAVMKVVGVLAVAALALLPYLRAGLADRLLEGSGIGELTFRGSTVIAGHHRDPGGPDPGGLSGLDTSADGTRFVAVGDRGAVVHGRFVFDGSGSLSGVAEVTVDRLLDVDGGPLRIRERVDAEGLARLDDGRWAVSFEHADRIMIHPGDGDRLWGIPVEIPRDATMDHMPGNVGIEALTVLPAGRLLAIEEKACGDDGTRHRAWIGGFDGWSLLTYRSRPGFVPVGAATLDDGDVLVLERRGTPLLGFSSRIQRIPASLVRPGAELSGREVAVLDRSPLARNFEGIAAATDGSGRTRIFLVSDNNFLPFHRTILVMFTLNEPAVSELPPDETPGTRSCIAQFPPQAAPCTASEYQAHGRGLDRPVHGTSGQLQWRSDP